MEPEGQSTDIEPKNLVNFIFFLISPGAADQRRKDKENRGEERVALSKL